MVKKKYVEIEITDGTDWYILGYAGPKKALVVHPDIPISNQGSFIMC
jgi:hypothetical protein